MTDSSRKYLEYIRNTGGNCPREVFIEDWEPIGEMLLTDLGLYIGEKDGNLYLTVAGVDLLESTG